MRILRTVILSIGLAALATACGGKSAPATTPDNTGGDETMEGAEGGDTYGAEGGDMGGDMGGDPCGDDMGADPCEGAE